MLMPRNHEYHQEEIGVLSFDVQKHAYGPKTNDTYIYDIYASLHSFILI